MDDNFKSIGAHWYSRKQTLSESIESICQFIIELEKQNPELFGKWYKKGKSKKEAMTKHFEFNYNNIKNEMDPKLMDDSLPDTAFRLSVWNGKEKDEESMSLSFSLGSEETKYFSNNCVIDLPYGGEERKFYDVISNQKKLINLFKSFWNPEWLLIDGKKIEL